MSQLLTDATAPSTLVVPIETSRQLLTVLLPFGGVVPPKALYRGQGRASWPLLPSVMRGIQDAHGRRLSRKLSDFDQVREEISQLRAFFSACDRQGLPIPKGHEEVFRTLAAYESSPDPAQPKTWPPENLLPAMALAQHHGVPTRLLDWTQNPFIACYFAAMQNMAFLRSDSPRKVVEIGKEQGDPKELALWLFYPIFHSPNDAGKIVDRWHTITPAYADNANLRVQSGALTYSETTLGDSNVFESIPFDQFVRDSMRTRSSSPLFVKFTLPDDEASNLLIDLDQLGVSTTTLFPGYDGAAADAKIKTSFEYAAAEAFHDQETVSSEEWLLDIKRRISERLPRIAEPRI